VNSSSSSATLNEYQSSTNRAPRILPESLPWQQLKLLAADSAWLPLLPITMVPMEDHFLEAAIQEAQQSLREGGIPNRFRSSYTAPQFSEGAITAASSAEARFCTARWMRLRTPGASQPPCTARSFSIRLCRHVPCVPVQFFCTEFREWSSAENQSFVGDEELLRGRGVSVQVLQNEECIRLMQEFIRDNPTLWNEDIGV